MALAIVVFVTALVVGTSLVATCALCIGTGRIRRSVDEFDTRLANIAPYLGTAALFFLLKRATHGISLRISRSLDWDITAWLYAVEGLFVARLQEAVSSALYPFFSGMYMFGFPYLLIVPLVAYFSLPSQYRLKELLVAYVLNYFVGTVCYTLFIAYGPRVRLSPLVAEPMYQSYPQTQELTAAVSANTNVFPSLHTSLSVVVLLFAWRTRREYPRWFLIASFVSASVVLSTMVLGIHWLLDIVAGAGLGAWSVVAASRIVSRVERNADRGSTRSRDRVEESTASDAGD